MTDNIVKAIRLLKWLNEQEWAKDERQSQFGHTIAFTADDIPYEGQQHIIESGWMFYQQKRYGQKSRFYLRRKDYERP